MLFDRTYDIIMQSLKARRRIIRESVDEERFKFNTDKFGSVVCDFIVVRDGVESTVFAKSMTGKFTFAVTDSSGQTKINDEKKFADNWPLDYNSFKETYEKYLEKQKEEKKEAAEADKDEGSGVESFDDIMKDEGGSEPSNSIIKKTKVITKGNDSFVFGILRNDDNVDKKVYKCQCEFQRMDEASAKTIYYKADIYLKESNSYVFKVNVMDSDGTLENSITLSELQSIDEPLVKNFKKALNDMETWVDQVYRFSSDKD